jgi:hypothetical protein
MSNSVSRCYTVDDSKITEYRTLRENLTTNCIPTVLMLVNHR